MTSVFFIFLSNFRARRRVALKQKKIGGSPSSLIESLSSSSSLITQKGSGWKPLTKSESFCELADHYRLNPISTQLQNSTIVGRST